MRIVSLVPGATEVVWALGLADRLVGRSHECDFPPEVARVPAVTRSLLPQGVSGARLDALVSQAVREHGALYSLDRELLAHLEPDLILTQGLCDVCAVAQHEVESAVAGLKLELSAPQVLSLNPMTLSDVLDQLHQVARALGMEERGWEVRRRLDARLQAVRERAAGVERPTVVCLEWLDPPWIAGHWVPEMVELAGGEDPLGRRGQRSRRAAWDEVRHVRPEVLILMPCGYDVQQAAGEYRDLRRRGGLPGWWDELPSVRAGRVFAVQAGACFSRPGPRVVDGVETLAELLHPEIFGRSRLGTDWLPLEPT